MLTRLWHDMLPRFYSRRKSTSNPVQQSLFWKIATDQKFQRNHRLPKDEIWGLSQAQGISLRDRLATHKDSPQGVEHSCSTPPFPMQGTNTRTLSQLSFKKASWTNHYLQIPFVSFLKQLFIYNHAFKDTWPMIWRPVHCWEQNKISHLSNLKRTIRAWDRMLAENAHPRVRIMYEKRINSDKIQSSLEYHINLINNKRNHT